LEPNCHFFTNTSPLSVLRDLVSKLEGQSVDCNFSLDSYKIKCIAYRENARVEFVVRVFCASEKVQQGGCKFAVEFQRRFGEGMFFYQIYRQVKDEIQAGLSEIRLCTPKDSSRMFECPKLIDDSLPPVSLDSQRESLKCLQAMCSCECVDVQTQALLALCDLSNQGGQVQQMMIQEGCLELLIACLACEYGDVHRLALTALANLTSGKNKTVCEQFFHHSTAKSHLKRCTQSECMQVVRESARAAANLADALGESCMNNEEFKVCVEQLTNCSDKLAQKHVLSLMDTLQLS